MSKLYARIVGWKGSRHSSASRTASDLVTATVQSWDGALTLTLGDGGDWFLYRHEAKPNAPIGTDQLVARGNVAEGAPLHLGDVGAEGLPAGETARRLGLCPDCLQFDHYHDGGCENVEALPDGLRECDECGRRTDAGEYPDWVNGVCEECDPSILDHPDNTERVGGDVASEDVPRYYAWSPETDPDFDEWYVLDAHKGDRQVAGPTSKDRATYLVRAWNDDAGRTFPVETAREARPDYLDVPNVARYAWPSANVAEDALRRFLATLNYELRHVLPDGVALEAWWWDGDDETDHWVLPVYVSARQVPESWGWEDAVLDLASATFVDQVRYALHQVTGDNKYADRPRRGIGHVLHPDHDRETCTDCNPDRTDWCGVCEATTVYDGERCTGCGRLWGHDEPDPDWLAAREDRPRYPYLAGGERESCKGCGFYIVLPGGREGYCNVCVPPAPEVAREDGPHYIAPEEATHLRVFRVSDEEWNIDAADDDGNYTEVCWDSRYEDVDGERRWEYIPTCAAAVALADAFAEENAPHLVGTRPKVSLGDLQAATDVASEDVPTYSVGIAVDGAPTYVVDVPTHLGRDAAERRARAVVFAQLRTVDLGRITVCPAELDATEDNRPPTTEDNRPRGCPDCGAVAPDAHGC